MNERLFVYGTLMIEGGIGRRWGLRRVGSARVRGRLYDLGWFPGLVLDDTGGSVKGEVVEVEGEEILRRLDAYEGYDAAREAGSLFLRRRCGVMMESGDNIRCWVYVYNRAVEAQRLIHGGEWLKKDDGAWDGVR